MLDNKKVILVGPAGAGKTTINKVYFEMCNPLNLLEFPLEPSRGTNYSVHSLFKSNLGIFDLAGQENDNWFSKGKDIFIESNVIISVFDIRNSLKSIIKFLIDLIRLKQELNLFQCQIVTFLHKIDLVKTFYVYHKIKTIKEFFKVHYHDGKDIKIYKTSVAKDYFFQTYFVILEILNLIYEKSLIPISKTEFQNLKTELSIILKCDHSTKYSINNLSYKFKLNSKKSKFHLKRLESVGLIKIENNFQFFQLTERAFFFKVGLDREKMKIKEAKIDKNIELFHIFFNLIP